MARANLRDTQIRAALEGIAIELAIIQDTSPVTRLRMEQAMQRTGLIGLMLPALDELDDICKSVREAQSQVNKALTKLIDKDDATYIF